MPGWTGVDLYHPDADEKVDLFRLPWPWKDSSVEAVAMFHLLEHFENVETIVKEVHRILVPDGLFWLKVPHAFGTTSCALGHKSFFTWWTVHELCSDVGHWFRWPQAVMFRQELYRVRYLTWRGSIQWTPLDFVASKWPQLFEKMSLVRPSEIEWRGRAIKDGAA